MFKTFNVSVRGIAPLLMHNGQMADPSNPFSKALKEITKKRTKTDTDHEAISHIEWQASLYRNASGKVIIPSFCIEASIRDGAKAQKLGKQFNSAVFVDQDALLDYPGPSKIDDLWKDPDFRDFRGVRVQKARVMRTRPIFKVWGCDFEVGFNPDLVDEAQVRAAIEQAGANVGMLDFRPKFGRFEVVS